MAFLHTARHVARATISVLFLSLSTCDDGEEPNPPSESDSGRSDADASTAPDSESDAGELSCGHYSGQVRSELNRALQEARMGCTDDRDCVVVSPDAGCIRTCPHAIVESSRQAFESAISLVTELCSSAPSSCFVPTDAPCAPVRGECVQGQCISVCDQPDWPDTTEVDGQFVRTGARCGELTCPDLPDLTDPRSEYALGCCTEDGSCGVFVSPLGPYCIARAEPGQPDPACPSETLDLYVDAGSGFLVTDSFPGCCRSDGVCGLDTSRTWGAGCIARSDFARTAQRTCTDGNVRLGQLEPIACDPQPQAP